MLVFLFCGLTMCDSWVRILFAEQPSLELTVIPSADGGRIVRLMNESLITSSMESEFYIDGSPTRLKTFLGYICGGTHDPGVVICQDQTEKISFTFHEVSGGYQVIADNGQCLTKMGHDSFSSGFYLNLKPCDRGHLQVFIIEEVGAFRSHLQSYGSPLFNHYYKGAHYGSLSDSLLPHSFSNYGLSSARRRVVSHVDVTPSSFNNISSYRRVVSRSSVV